MSALATAFQMYWEDLERCRSAKAYWSMLHVIVCIPDICGALQAPNGEATQRRYEAWCNKYLVQPLLSAAERYVIRCALLHQGHAITGKSVRYIGIAYGQPSSSGTVDHMRVDGEALHLDASKLMDETKLAVDRRIQLLTA